MSELDIVEAMQSRYTQVMARVADAARRSGRKPQDVLVLAVSKLQSVEKIRAVYSAGIRAFGESYVEEALPKIESLNDLSEARWEMVGHVQSRKAKLVANAFSRIHSLGTQKLARLLDRHREPGNGPLDVLMQVNLSGEDSKQGIVATKRETWRDVLAFAQELKAYPNSRLTGLMTMPPLFDDPEHNRPYFRQLRELRDYLNEQDPSLNLTELSMGTSYDFEIAVEEGATIVRLGSILLGERQY